MVSSFEAVLGSLRRDHCVAAASGKPFVRAFFLADGKLACGFAATAERSFEDFARDSAPPEPLPSDAMDAIASELDLPGNADSASLRRLRRRFLWANHPDRRPDLPRDLANRRVAIANMLIDRALKATRSGDR